MELQTASLWVMFILYGSLRLLEGFDSFTIIIQYGKQRGTSPQLNIDHRSIHYYLGTSIISKRILKSVANKIEQK